MRSMGIDCWRRHRWLVGCIMICLWTAGTAGCGKTVIVGLQPIYPPVVRRSISLLTEYVEVGSLTPTFRWQPLSASAVEPSADSESDRPGTEPMDRITYELRIWRPALIKGDRLVYVREGLTGTEHRLETPLEPDTRYLWSVRAHFSIGGRSRISEWTLAGYLLRNEAVPNDSCLRFKTPLEERIK